MNLASDLGCRAVAWLTSMDAPLGAAVGNGLEVLEAMEVLAVAGPADVRALTLRLGAEMLVLARKAGSIPEAERRLEAAIDDGSGLARFRALVRAQGGDPTVLDAPAILLGPLVTAEVRAPREGVVTEWTRRRRARRGRAGRRPDAERRGHRPGVGFTVRRSPGDRVDRGEPLVLVHHRPGKDVSEVCRRLAGGFHSVTGGADAAAAHRPGGGTASMSGLLERLEESAAAVRARVPGAAPEVALVLGSGLAGAVRLLEEAARRFPSPTFPTWGLRACRDIPAVSPSGGSGRCASACSRAGCTPTRAAAPRRRRIQSSCW